MDNLTHSFVGLAAAKAGLERLSPYATAVCVVAANAPDADIAALAGGRWFYLHHHRGITHSIVGTLALGLVVPLLFFACDRLAARLRGRPPRARLRGLLVASLLVIATHPLLDWTNNYGLRPFLPWSGRWFYGDLVNIIDPFIWLLLGGACFLLTATGRRRVAAWAALALLLTAAVLLLPGRAGMPMPAASRAVWLAGLFILAAAHLTKLAGRWREKIAVGALSLVVAYWGGLAVLHRRALTLARATAQARAQKEGETLLRVAAMPLMADPLRWRAVADTDRATFRFRVSLRESTSPADGGSDVVRYEKPLGEEAALLERAAEEYPARVFLDFARFPVARVLTGCAGDALVQLADLRYTEPGRAGRGSFALEVAVPPAR